MAHKSYLTNYSQIIYSTFLNKYTKLPLKIKTVL